MTREKERDFRGTNSRRTITSNASSPPGPGAGDRVVQTGAQRVTQTGADRETQ